jgi:GNAT superfamily N-acetyltransferase
MIRAAVHADIPALLELGRQMHAESRFAYLPFDLDHVGSTLATLISEPYGCVLVWEDREILGGFAGAVVPFFFCQRHRYATDLAVFVRKDRRGGMIAARLVEQFAEWAREAGATEINLGVSTGIHPEKTGAFYERMGYERSGGFYIRRLECASA